MVIDLAEKHDQPEHEVQFLQAIEEQARTRCRQNEITRVGVPKCCLACGPLTQLKNRFVCTMAKLTPRKPESKGTSARTKIGEGGEIRPAGKAG